MYTGYENASPAVHRFFLFSRRLRTEVGKRNKRCTGKMFFCRIQTFSLARFSENLWNASRKNGWELLYVAHVSFKPAAYVVSTSCFVELCGRRQAKSCSMTPIFVPPYNARLGYFRVHTHGCSLFFCFTMDHYMLYCDAAVKTPNEGRTRGGVKLVVMCPSNQPKNKKATSPQNNKPLHSLPMTKFEKTRNKPAYDIYHVVYEEK